MARLGACQLLEVVAYTDSFECWDSTAVEHPVDQAYADELDAARTKTGLDESVMTGSVTIRGRRVAILLSEFAFLAGSIDVAAGDRLVTLAGEIARCIADMVDLDTPTVSLLLGQGTGGGALALVPADRVLAAQHAWLSPLPPEGASAIVHRDVEDAAEMADRQCIRSIDLRRAGIVDLIIPELPDAAGEVQQFRERVGAALHRELAELISQDGDMRMIARAKRFNRVGYGSSTGVGAVD